jgi:membrane protein DedA with SNARE-associated domain
MDRARRRHRVRRGRHDHVCVAVRVQSLLDWLVTLGSGTLYTVLFLAAGLENLFPPFPSDVVVAFGSFVAAQGSATAFGVFLVTWLGNVGTAMLVYVLGRRYGARRVERRLAGKHAESRDAKLRAMLKRLGMPAVFLSRFIPGVRALVPAVAGALRFPVLPTTAMIGTASAIWYGLITFVAFRVGADWPRLKVMVGRYSTTAAIVGSILLALGVAVWLLVRKRQKQS